MLPTDKLTEINLNLWQHFNNEADKTKDRMWTIASWMFTLQAGVIAFIADHFSIDNSKALIIDNLILIKTACAIGVFLSAYTIFMIRQYGYHINSMWVRANYIRRQTTGLTEIWFAGNDTMINKDKKPAKEEGVPLVALRLIYFCIGFMVIFITLFCIMIF